MLVIVVMDEHILLFAVVKLLRLGCCIENVVKKLYQIVK